MLPMFGLVHLDLIQSGRCPIHVYKLKHLVLGIMLPSFEVDPLQRCHGFVRSLVKGTRSSFKHK